MAFLQVHFNGKSILPVSDKIGKTSSISWFNYGWNLIVSATLILKLIIVKIYFP